MPMAATMKPSTWGGQVGFSGPSTSIRIQAKKPPKMAARAPWVLAFFQ